ncbi:hypothetical protein EV121DRAFT_297537 [Schizophyllum commune]
MSPSCPPYPPALPEAHEFSGSCVHLLQYATATLYSYPAQNLTKEGVAAASSLPEGTGPQSFWKALEAGNPEAWKNCVGKSCPEIGKVARDIRNRAIAAVTTHRAKVYSGKDVYKTRSLIFDLSSGVEVSEYPPVLYADASEVAFSSRAVLMVVETCFRSHDRSQEGSPEGSQGGRRGGSLDKGKARYLHYRNWLLSHWEDPGVQHKVVGPAQALLQKLLEKVKAGLEALPALPLLQPLLPHLLKLLLARLLGPDLAPPHIAARIQ